MEYGEQKFGFKDGQHGQPSGRQAWERVTEESLGGVLSPSITRYFFSSRAHLSLFFFFFHFQIRGSKRASLVFSHTVCIDCGKKAKGWTEAFSFDILALL